MATATEEPQKRQPKLVDWLRRLGAKLKADFSLLFNFHFALCTFTYVNFVLDFVAFIIILPDVAKDQGIAGEHPTCEMARTNSAAVLKMWTQSGFYRSSPSLTLLVVSGLAGSHTGTL